MYDIVIVLACYKNNGKDVELDSDFCDGTAQVPKPNGKMNGQKFQVSSNDKTKSCTVHKWIQSVQDGNSPDRLSEDQLINGSIGGLKGALENVLNTNRAVPLFEFRRLPSVKTGDMKGCVDKAEKAVISYHEANAKPPARFIRKRLDTKFSNIKRQGSPACAAPSNTGFQTTPIPSAGADSCDVSFQVVDVYFEIRGKDWPDSKLSTNGDGLKT